jgi:hypothetical protein
MANRTWLESSGIGAGEAVPIVPESIHQAAANVDPWALEASTAERPEAGRFAENEDAQLAENITLGYD